MRNADWFKRLTEVIAEHDNTPFEYGSSDCACFVDDAIFAITGKQLYKERAKNEAEVLKFLAKNKIKSPAGILEKHLIEKPCSFAQTGDAAIIDTPEGEACGIFVGSVILSKSHLGLCRTMRSNAKRAFGVD